MYTPLGPYLCVNGFQHKDSITSRPFVFTQTDSDQQNRYGDNNHSFFIRTRESPRYYHSSKDSCYNVSYFKNQIFLHHKLGVHIRYKDIMSSMSTERYLRLSTPILKMSLTYSYLYVTIHVKFMSP